MNHGGTHTMMRKPLLSASALCLLTTLAIPLPALADGMTYGPFSGVDGKDASANAPTLLPNTLATFIVTQPGMFWVQNQSNDTIQVVLDGGTGPLQPGTNSTPTVEVLGPGSAGAQGASTDPIPWFTGRVRVLGPAAGDQVAARYW